MSKYFKETELKEETYPDRKIFDRKYFKSHHFRWKLARIISRIFRISGGDAKRLIRDMRPLNDEECIQKLKDLVIINSSKTRTSDIISKLPSEFHNKHYSRYLDIGCNTGSITKQVGDTLGCDFIAGIDVQEHLETYIENFIQYDGIHIPFPDNSFDLITLFQTLHHVDDVLSLRNEILRVLKPQGSLLIKEHNCINSESSKLIDLEHFLYTLKGCKYEIQKCLSKEDWDKVFIDLIPTWHYMYENDPTDIYYSLYINKI